MYKILVKDQNFSKSKSGIFPKSKNIIKLQNTSTIKKLNSLIINIKIVFIELI